MQLIKTLDLLEIDVAENLRTRKEKMEPVY